MTTITERSRVGLTPTSRLLLAGAGAVLGAGLGLLLDPLTGWATGQAWLPAQVVVELLGMLAAATPAWLQLLVGLGVGAAAGLLVASQATVVEVADDEIVVLEGRKRRRLARSQVGAAVIDRRRLSVRDHADVDLLDVSVDGDVEELRRALRAHAWQVRD
jgi:hypothetical protein